jgi:hypothetical protein
MWQIKSHDHRGYRSRQINLLQDELLALVKRHRPQLLAEVWVRSSDRRDPDRPDRRRP